MCRSLVWCRASFATAQPGTRDQFALQNPQMLAWYVPCSTHTYLVEESLIPGIQSLEMRLLSNLTGFCKNCCDCKIIRLTARDLRTSIGKNLAKIQEPRIANKAQLQHDHEKTLQTSVPKIDYWKPRLLMRLLTERSLARFAADKSWRRGFLLLSLQSSPPKVDLWTIHS